MIITVLGLVLLAVSLPFLATAILDASGDVEAVETLNALDTGTDYAKTGPWPIGAKAGAGSDSVTVGGYTEAVKPQAGRYFDLDITGHPSSFDGKVAGSWDLPTAANTYVPVLHFVAADPSDEDMVFGFRNNGGDLEVKGWRHPTTSLTCTDTVTGEDITQPFVFGFDFQTGLTAERRELEMFVNDGDPPGLFPDCDLNGIGSGIDMGPFSALRVPAQPGLLDGTGDTAAAWDGLLHHAGALTVDLNSVNMASYMLSPSVRGDEAGFVSFTTENALDGAGAGLWTALTTTRAPSTARGA